MNLRNASVVMGSVLVLASAVPLLAQAPATKEAVATVGGLRIERDEYETRLANLRAQMSQRGTARPEAMDDLFRRQVLETMIRLRILTLEAKRTGVTATTAEAESVLKADAFFSPNGTFDADRWRLTRMSQPGRFQSAVASAGEQLAARRLNDRLEQRFRPSESDLRSRAVRQLRTAVTEDLSLRTADFDGRYPEPRESDILAYYRANPEEFRRPSRATLSVVFVNDPPPTEADRRVPERMAAWTQRMRGVADSVIAAVRRGATLEDASASLGGPRPDVTVLPGNFPGYWRADATDRSPVFKARDGQVLEQALPANEGWLVVRVDRLEPTHIAPLQSVAPSIRKALREDSRLHHDERDQRALYAQVRDSLATTAWVIRWAAVDTSDVRLNEPSLAELDRWYRGHLADFSTFDAATGTIRAQPFDEVREEVRVRWRRDTRVLTARTQADDLYRAWNAGRRAPALELALRVRESQPIPMRAPVDTGFAGGALSDALWRGGEPTGTRIQPYGRGFLVWQVVRRVDGHVPSFEQVQPALARRIADVQRASEERGARELYERDPRRFGGGKVYHFSRMVVPWPALDQVELTREQVERWHRRNLDKYAAQELVRIKHILIEPIAKTTAADRAARARADSLLARIRAGESFDALAARFSDDPATKDKGGDIGVFARGAMLQEFEDVAFSMREGDLRGPVRTEVGWHIMQCTEYVPEYVQPLTLVYTIVASDLAKVEADTIAMLRADSLIRHIRTAAQGRAIAERHGFQVITYVKPVDEPHGNARLDEYFDILHTLRTGEVMSKPWIARGEGYWITWVDSVTTAGPPAWSAAQGAALNLFREGAGERAMLAKVAELDSLATQGWSLDSLGVLWGGLARSKRILGRDRPEESNLPAALDSLVFGRGNAAAALAQGQESGWVRWPGGVARVRLQERQEPSPEMVRERMGDLARIAIERRMYGWFQDAKRRHPVNILDRSLRAIPIPEPPDEDETPK